MRALAILIAVWLAGCGPERLPRFANPPEPDAGIDANGDDAGQDDTEHSDDDAG